MWNKELRLEYQPLIIEISKSIDEQLKLWATTGKEEHKLFADHQIKHLIEIKEFILKEESK